MHPAPDAPRNCPDCGAHIGDPHDSGCDVARCLATGGQRLMCELDDGILAELFGIPVSNGQPGHHCGHQVWTGLWPGVAECREFGWYSFLQPPEPGVQYGQWIRCEPDDPRGSEDLNRLHIEARWDPEQARFVQRADTFGILCVECDSPDLDRTSCNSCGALQIRRRPWQLGQEFRLTIPADREEPE